MPSSSSSDDDKTSRDGGSSSGTSTAPFAAPKAVVFHKDPDRDDIGVKATLEGATTLGNLIAVWDSIRVIAFVALPLFVIGIHPNTRERLGYPQLLLATIITVSTHRESLGEEIGKRVWVLLATAIVLAAATCWDALNIAQHRGAWYGLLAASLFLSSLCSHSAVRSYLYMLFFMTFFLTRVVATMGPPGAAPQRVPVSTAGWLALDLCIGAGVSVAANVLPFPFLASRGADEALGVLFAGVGQVLRGMHALAGTDLALQATIFYLDRSVFDGLEAVHSSVLPPLLWAVSFEPWEYFVRNRVRRLRLSLWRRILTLTHAAFATGRTISEARRGQFNRNRVLGHTADGSASQREAAAEAEDLVNACAVGYVREFGRVLVAAVTALGTCGNSPAGVLAAIDFDELEEAHRRFRHITHMQILEMLRRRTESATKTYDAFANSSSSSSDGDEDGGAGESSSASTLAELSEVEVPTPGHHRRDPPQHEHEVSGSAATAGAPAAASAGQQSKKRNKGSKDPSQRKDEGKEDLARSALVALAVEGAADSEELFLFIKQQHFHLLLSLIATEILAFRNALRDYRPRRSLCRRIFDDLVRDNWRSFWASLADTVLVRTAQEVRRLKDGVKMCAALLTVAAFSLEIYPDVGGLQHLGVMVLFGIPWGEESLRVTLARAAGLTLGCSFAYLAYHNTKNMSEMVGCSFSFMFICQIFLRHRTFGSAFFYTVSTTMAYAINTADTYALLKRLSTTADVIFVHFIVLMLIFPTNTIKILHNFRARYCRVASEIADDIAMTLRLPMEFYPCEDEDEENESGEQEQHEPFAGTTTTNNNTSTNRQRAVGRLLQPKTEVVAMFSHLTQELRLLHRLDEMDSKWAGLLSLDINFIRGSQGFPAGPSHQVSLCLTRLLASLHLIVFSLELLYRPRRAPPDPAIVAIARGPLADFMTSFADGCRLFFQDVIDAMQRSRTFSYPTALGHITRLVSLRAVMRYRVVQWVASLRGQILVGVPPLQDAHREALAREADRQRQREEQQQQRHQQQEVRVAAAPEAEGEGDNDEGDSAAAGSIAEVFLAQRRRSARGGNASSAHEPAQPREAEGGNGDDSGECGEDEEGSGRGGAAILGSDMREAYGQYPEMYPYPPDNAENTIRVELLRKLERQTAAQQRESDRLSAAWRPSKLVLEARAGPEPRLPYFAGLPFHYLEDPLLLPIDHDFQAIVCMLSTCGSAFYEMERLLNAINAMSGYFKDAHEYTLVLKLIDKVSPKISAYRQSVRERYSSPEDSTASDRRNPPPPGEGQQ